MVNFCFLKTITFPTVELEEIRVSCWDQVCTVHVYGPTNMRQSHIEALYSFYAPNWSTCSYRIYAGVMKGHILEKPHFAAKCKGVSPNEF